MATLQIENLPEHLYGYLQNLATTQNISLNETVIQLLQQISYSVESIAVERTHSTAEIFERIRSRPRRDPMSVGLSGSTA